MYILHLDLLKIFNFFQLSISFGHVRDKFSWLSQKMDNSLNTLSNKMEQMEQRTATEHAQLTSSLTAAVEQNRKWAWELDNKMRMSIDEQITALEKVRVYAKLFRSQ